MTGRAAWEVTVRLVTVASALLLVEACATQPRPAVGPAPVQRETARVILGDTFTTPWDAGPAVLLARLWLRSPDGLTRPLGFFVAESYCLPVLVRDSVVLVVAFDSLGTRIGLVRYDIQGKRMDTLPLPSDLPEGVTDVSIAPDGQRLAYVSFPGDYTGFGIVRGIPAGPIELQTPTITVEATDVRVGLAEWLSDRTVRFWIAPASGQADQWVRFRGTLGATAFVVDTVLADTLAGPHGT
jgi:hypothetical protein